MKNLRKIFAIVLSAFTLFAAGCKNDTQTEETTDENVEGISRTENLDYERGIHELNYTKTNDFLVKDNHTEYKLLMPENPSAELEFAANELKLFFKEATKANLAVISDTDVSGDLSNAKYISLGNTTYAAEAGVTATKELDRYGYTIQTVGKSVFINANSDIGVTFGVYGFLELQFNFECYSDVLYYIDKQDDAPLLDFEVRDVPDMKIRLRSSQYADGNGLRRQKLIIRSTLFAGPYTVHAALEQMPPDNYLDHLEWFSDDKMQLCYTAHGNEESRQLLMEAVANVVIKLLKDNPDKYYVSFGHTDKSVWCVCDSCNASFEKYHSRAAAPIQLFNGAAEIVEEWMKTDEGKPYARDFEIMHLAYGKTIEPPVEYDEATDTYTPVDETVIPREHTMIMFCPIGVDVQQGIYAEINKESYEYLRGWKAVAPEVDIFCYGMNYTCFWEYYDNISHMKDYLQALASMNVQLFYEEGQSSMSGGTAWTALKSYLEVKLSWNVNLDIDELVEDFFNHYYADGADELYEVYLATRALGRKNSVDLSQNRHHFGQIDLPEYWPKNYALDAMDKIEKALNDISYMQTTDPVLYKTIYNNIVSERVSYEYILVKHYGDQFTKEELLALKLQTKKDAEDNGITMFSMRPEVPSSSIWAQWGI